MLEEPGELYFSSHWIEFERLHAAVMAKLPVDCKTGEADNWIRDRLVRRLQGWIDRGLIEKFGCQSRARKGLSAMKAHLAAKHCSDLLDLVRRPVLRI